MRIFVCHSSGDKKRVRALCQKLKSSGFDPWLDEEKLLPGQDWDQEIRKAVRLSDVILVCLSNDSVGKRGYVQKEIKLALDVADEIPEQAIFIIPVRLEECDIPNRLQRWQRVDLFDRNGYRRLRRALDACGKKVRPKRPLREKKLAKSKARQRSTAHQSPATEPQRHKGTINCRYCRGTGRVGVDFLRDRPCSICKGKGKVVTDRIGQPDCRYCGGSGEVGVDYLRVKPCPICGGIGLEPHD